MASPRIIGGIVAVGVIAGVMAAVAIVWRPAMSAIDPSAAPSFDSALEKKGRDLAAIGNCNDCHTVRGGKDFAGGLPVQTPFGTIYSLNIMPDPDTGIGHWSEAAFRRAMQSGINRDGQHLYPTFPYDHFTHVSDDDDRALYAYLMTRQPVRAAARANRLALPFNKRVAVAGWKLLFLRHGTHQPDSTKSAEWNRGLYLVEGLRIAAPATRHATRSARNRRTSPLPAAMSTTGTLTRSTGSRRRRCRGMPRRCLAISATAGIPTTALRADRWPRW
jgi:mono/diheme cytochrome c family protein